MDSLTDLKYLARAWVLAAVLLPYSFAPGPLAAQSVQQPAQKTREAEAKTPAVASPTPADSPADAGDPLPGDWAPELLDGILSAQNPTAGESLYDAAFAAGPGLIPQLQAALKDDRTAEFAAQALAFLGGDQAEQILQTLVSDPRDLDLRRFYLGSLGEYPAPELERLLLNAVAKSDAEPDRTVTEAAIWALTVRSEPDLPDQMKRAEAGIQDVAIRDELDNARQVIEARLAYLASPAGRDAAGSLDQAVRTYFIGALPKEPAPAARPAAASARHEPPGPTLTVKRTIFSPDQTRALAHVTFEDSEASANYDMILQKQLGDWKVVSVWEGPENEKPEAPAENPSTPHRRNPARRSATRGNVAQPTH
jgi:hypothetical protein